MYLAPHEVQQLTEDRLRRFLAHKIPEGHHIDYKLDYPRDANLGLGGNDARREFLKDITAFANANGGDLIIGVDEPREDRDVDAQIHGIEEWNKLSAVLERLARDNVDPAIPALIIKPIALRSGKGLIVVHVPPSNSRPYRVSHSGYVNFFLRHSESIFPMNTHDIREAVITSASVEAKAQQYLAESERDIDQYVTLGAKALLLQAMPLISPYPAWAIMDADLLSVIRDTKRIRQQRFARFSLESTVAPTRTLEGVMGRDDRANPTFITEVRSNGYISVVIPQPLDEMKTQENTYNVLSRAQFELFQSFACFCTEVLEVARTDLPYLLRCTLLHASGTFLYIRDARQRFNGPWRKPKLQWPDQVRQTGELFETTASLVGNALPCVQCGSTAAGCDSRKKHGLSHVFATVLPANSSEERISCADADFLKCEKRKTKRSGRTRMSAPRPLNFRASGPSPLPGGGEQKVFSILNSPVPEPAGTLLG